MCPIYDAEQYFNDFLDDITSSDSFDSLAMYSSFKNCYKAIKNTPSFKKVPENLQIDYIISLVATRFIQEQTKVLPSVSIMMTFLKSIRNPNIERIIKNQDLH